MAVPNNTQTQPLKDAPNNIEDDEKKLAPSSAEKQAARESAKKNKTIWVGKPTEPFEDDYIKIKQLGNAGQYGVT
eukprot:CAMPEP_0201578216 /NCGR_PEP_ID=MMETSP0190_2-20130828/25009_1 /ASSEMBLY_ACC=CAM_ASM_000263 /TAXON_ID=37353 /ORGANISM="Rosalina sp." /LENGTH=74 /DNA_ID=CAMNT_0048011163 /DNA_START=29 /DNA_END=249 /DNA_ORIENTATION=+